MVNVFQKAKRIGIDASAMLIACKHGYENYVEALLLNIIEMESELDGLKLIFYFHAGNPLADPRQLDTILPRFKNFTCRIYRPGRLFGVALPLMAAVDRLDWMHLPVYLWSRWYPCPVGITFHDACGVRVGSEGTSSGAAKHELIVRQRVSLASAYIAVSESTARDMVKFYGVPAEKIRVVYHGTDPFFRPSPDDWQRVKTKYGLDRYILDVNALQTHKNHKRLLAAFARLRKEYGVSHQLVLVGREGWGADQIQTALAQPGLGDAVRYFGYVPREDLRGLYSGADLVVNPSLCEGFGLPLLEAMACGAVVAASNTTALPEVGGDAVLYFDPLDIESITATIWEGLSNIGLREELKERGRRRVKQFSWQKAARDTVVAYRSWHRD